MSKCISNHGEFSEHEVSNGVCEFCGAVEMDYDNLRAALVAVQELHKPVREWPSYREYVLICGVCKVYAPCPTRRLADEGLGGETNG